MSQHASGVDAARSAELPGSTLTVVRWLLPALLALGAAQAAAQTTLKLPTSQGELRAFLGETGDSTALKLPTSQGELRAFLRETGDSICAKCGVVTSTRVLAAADAGSRLSAPPIPGSSAVDSETKPVPFGSERARYERDRMLHGPAPRHEVVVRYDDGSFGRIELARDPQLKLGDRVKVDGGSVARYP